MSVSVITAVTDAGWEAELVSGLDRGDHGVSVVRRCVDVADLLAAASTGTAQAVVLSADLRRLDREVLGRLDLIGVAVVGLVEPGDDTAEHRLRQLGVHRVLPADAGVVAVAEALCEAAAAVSADRRVGDLADPRAALPRLGEAPAAGGQERGPGRIVAVWGPTGAPGRTTVAVAVADEAARLGVPALLIDADVYGGVVAQVLGLLDEAPGFAAATRLDTNGQLDLGALAGLARGVGPWLRVLTGISRADRWPELRPESVRSTLELCRRLVAFTVVDCGFGLEQDEEIAYDTVAPRRNGATLAVLEAADTVLAVGAADPVGLHRLIRGLAELREVQPDVTVRVVVNKVRPGVTPGHTRREVAAALDRHAGVRDAVFLPYDRAALDRALGAGRTLAEVAPGSALRTALADTAALLAGMSTPAQRRGRRRSSG